ncbi:uncharacterized protein [Rutidosis leptorrhynchoides]|uniref:uncharacterized protein isoform X5 n=1 Tax=Rutidosis leptorrhynchoides TaxID=125765 RepID=UPI003A9A0FDD
MIVSLFSSSGVQKWLDFEIDSDLFRIVTFAQVNEKLLTTDEVFDDVGRVVHITADRVIRDKNVVRIKGWNFNCLLQVSIFVALFGIQTTMIIKDQTGACEIILFDTQLNKIVNKK